MSIFITGDIHGSYDIGKLSSSQFDASSLTKKDYVIICGDFGLVWDNTASEQYWLRWLAEKPFTTLFVDGNHEGFRTLNALPTETWHGGQVHRINDSVFHLVRGQLFDIDGAKVFTMGGAASSDYDITHRKEGISWFPEEIPSQEERDEAYNTLSNANWKCDLVITHCAPSACKEDIAERTDRLQLHPMDEYTDWLETVRQNLSYKHWFCGHYHFDGSLTRNVTVLYNEVVKIDTDALLSNPSNDSHRASKPFGAVKRPKSAAKQEDPFESLEDEIE